MARQSSRESSSFPDEQLVREGFWPKLNRSLSYLPFADKLAAAFYCATDDATPFKVRATLLGALAYFILPFDLIPDVVLGLGFTDDMAVLVTAFTMIRNNMTQDHLDKGREAVERMRRGEMPFAS
ncbi:MAG TPA: YkvA family protein [Aestuariivirgaceae bacterium]|jgi:uncharacterized membrane protein YkvA (DUF1232 family)